MNVADVCPSDLLMLKELVDWFASQLLPSFNSASVQTSASCLRWLFLLENRILSVGINICITHFYLLLNVASTGSLWRANSERFEFQWPPIPADVLSDEVEESDTDRRWRIWRRLMFSFIFALLSFFCQPLRFFFNERLMQIAARHAKRAASSSKTIPTKKKEEQVAAESPSFPVRQCRVPSSGRRMNSSHVVIAAPHSDDSSSKIHRTEHKVGLTAITELIDSPEHGRVFCDKPIDCSQVQR